VISFSSFTTESSLDVVRLILLVRPVRLCGSRCH
jgi:hypothetical protein